MPRRSESRPRRPTLALAATLAALCASLPAGASETLVYELELLPGRNVGYHLDFELVAPGIVRLRADWDGTRIVAFRVDGPAGVGTVARRSGPPPIDLAFEVDGRAAQAEGPWRVSMRGLPSREHARGTLTIRLPGPTPAESAPSEAGVVRLEPAVGEPDRPAWQRPAARPVGARADVARLHDAIERFRRLVVDDPLPDGYDWQLGLLEFLAERRDRLTLDDAQREVATWRALRRLAESIERLEALRTTDDPVLLEPPPESDSLRAAWRMVLAERFDGHRRLLDDLLAAFQDRDRIPALRQAGWPVQFVTCLQACRRHFETRHPDEGAVRPHAEVVEMQWERALAAGDAIRRLLEATPGVDPNPPFNEAAAAAAAGTVAIERNRAR